MRHKQEATRYRLGNRRHPHVSPCDNLTWQNPVMATEEEQAAASVRLKKLRAEREALERKLKDCRSRTSDEIVSILMARTLEPGKVASDVGYDRNHVGRLGKAGGVPPLRAATVVSKKKAAEG